MSFEQGTPHSHPATLLPVAMGFYVQAPLAWVFLLAEWKMWLKRLLVKLVMNRSPVRTGSLGKVRVRRAMDDESWPRGPGLAANTVGRVGRRPPGGLHSGAWILSELLLRSLSLSVWCLPSAGKSPLIFSSQNMEFRSGQLWGKKKVVAKGFSRQKGSEETLKLWLKKKRERESLSLPTVQATEPRKSLDCKGTPSNLFIGYRVIKWNQLRHKSYLLHTHLSSPWVLRPYLKCFKTKWKFHDYLFQ